ncbi:MAG: endonuclease/exonuclease/phosphatase family protein [Phycisphaerales bacterium]
MPRRSKQLVKQDFKPGIIGWVRRRVLPLLAKGTAMLGILMLGAWITGRVLTDEHHWSQYLYWLPPIVMIGGAWVLLILSTILAAMARRLGGLLLRPVLLLLAIGCTIHLVFGVWHTHRLITTSSDKAPDAIRVLHWNHGGKSIDADAWGERINQLDTDIVLFANPEWGEERQALLDQFTHFAPDDRVRWVNYSYRVNADPAHFRVEGHAVIASRYPMTRTGKVHFGEHERQEVMNRSSSSNGWVLFAEFDLDPARGDDQPLVVWFVDLPSNPTAWKMDEMRTVRSAIDSWNGAGWEMGRNVWEQYQDESASFPDPDLIIGDFNTPRGSASIDLLAPAFKDAFEQGGHGRGRSFRVSGVGPGGVLSAVVDLHIDLALVAPAHGVNYYTLLGSAETDHTPQIVDIHVGNR